MVEAVHNDINRLPQWYAGVEEAIADGVYPKAGGKVKLIYKVAGITFEMTNTCLEYEYARYGRNEMEGMITGSYEEISQPVEDGTRFTMNYDYQMPGREVGKIIDRLYAEKMMVKFTGSNTRDGAQGHS